MRRLNAREIKEATDLASIVEEYGVKLRRDGAWRKGVCPFHQDKTPSFKIIPNGSGWKCFGCGKKGDVYTFLELVRTRDFTSNVEYLRERLGCVPPVPRLSIAPEPVRSVIRPPGVGKFYARCVSVDTDAVVRSWCSRRGLDAKTIALHDLARVIPEGLKLPAWIGKPWVASKGYRLVLPVFDGQGAIRSVRLRTTHRNREPKSLAPRGHTAGRAVMADGLGRWLLRGEEKARKIVERVGIYIVEGEPDFLTAASLSPRRSWRPRWSGDGHPAVFGLFQSAWCDEIARRIPGDSIVTIWPHDNPRDSDGLGVGERYAHEVRDSLLKLGFEPSRIRWVRLTKAKDVNELHMIGRRLNRPPRFVATVMPDRREAA